jgi:hypothetical protein
MASAESEPTWDGHLLLLLRPQQPVAGILALLGADQVITIRGIGTASP